jgi:hypothetical protein
VLLGRHQPACVDVTAPRTLLAATALCSCTAVAAAPAAAPRLTIGVRPTSVVAFDNAVTIYGLLAGAGGGEDVTYEAKECGIAGSFHLVGVASTAAGGAFSSSPALPPGVKTSYRARWRDVVSNVVVVQVAPHVELRRSGRHFTVVVSGHGYLRGKHVSLQRRASGRWAQMRTLTIRDTFGNGGLASGAARVPRGVAVRAVLSRSHAAPCFLPAISNTVRT